MAPYQKDVSPHTLARSTSATMCFRAENVTAHLSLSRAGVRADSMKNNVTTGRASERERKGERFQENASALPEDGYTGGKDAIHREGRYPRGRERPRGTESETEGSQGSISHDLVRCKLFRARTENANAAERYLDSLGESSARRERKRVGLRGKSKTPVKTLSRESAAPRRSRE